MKRKYGTRLNGNDIELVAHEVIPVHALPKCDFCAKTAEYDFKTKMGPWANGCEQHWAEYAAVHYFGTGVAQLLVAESTVHEVITAS